MPVNRRGFLGALAATAAAFALDPERALWVPGAKTISIAKPIRFKAFLGPQYVPLAFCRDAYLLQWKYNCLVSHQVELVSAISVPRPPRFPSA